MKRVYKQGWDGRDFFYTYGFCDFSDVQESYLQGRELKPTILTSKVSGLKVLKKDYGDTVWSSGGTLVCVTDVNRARYSHP